MKEFGTAVILAGGQSLRMGFDKNKLSINGDSLQKRQIRALSTVFAEIIVVANDEQGLVAPNCHKIRDEIPGKGPLGGIYSGLLHANSKFVYFLACDMPSMNMDYVRYMMGKLRHTDYEACVTRITPHIEPLNAFYSRSILPSIKADLLADKLSVYHLLRQRHCLFVEEAEARQFSPDWQMFLNLNTREDLANYCEGNL